MADANDTEADRQAQKRVQKCIEAMLASARHKPLARELLKLLDHKAEDSEAKNSAGPTIDI